MRQCKRAVFSFFQDRFKTPAALGEDSERVDSGSTIIILDTQFERPAVVLLSAVWTLAAVLSALALLVSCSADERASRTVQPPEARVVVAQPSENRASSSMLVKSGNAISKDKLD
ncbi:MAG: hypothetical protein KF891_01515 [Rhizobacter sp.]|nr:hypothetical protein [Rhizobacter sp.]